MTREFPSKIAAEKEVRRLETCARKVKEELDAVDKLREACEPFCHFLAFLEALQELDGEAPLNDSEVVDQVSGGGGSAVLTVGDFRALRDALTNAPLPRTGRSRT